MPRKVAASARKRQAEDLPEDGSIDPESYFGSVSSTTLQSKPKAQKPALKRADTHDEPSAALASMDIDDDPSAEIGFPANELPDVAPKKFWKAPAHSGIAGSVELPDGAPGCLDGLKFVVTGEFVGLSREGITDLIKSFGGQVTSAVSGKTSYLVVGNDPGSSKIKKAKTLKTRCLHEDDLLKLIRSSKTSEPQAVEEPEAPAVKDEPSSSAKPAAAPASNADAPMASSPQGDRVEAELGLVSKGKEAATQLSQSSQPVAEADGQSHPPSELWTDKYRPTKLRDLCGHKEPAKRILRWLSVWANGEVPAKRSVLISGPPGIGKTTTAHLVGKLAGFDVLELNASETRNKSTLQSLLGSAIGNRSVLEFDRARVKRVEDEFENEQDKDVAGSVSRSGMKKLLVIMDEVDGMSGGDRGGSTELIQLIKRTKVPIICICNDRQSTKVRSLANYCEDERFRRPSEAQMRARLNTIAFRENLKIDQNAIGQMVQSTHNDIRQIINLMSSYALSKPSMTYLESKEYAAANKKEVAVDTFSATGKLLSASDNMGMTFNAKLDMYYADFSIMPLFVQENYVDMMPNGAANQVEQLEKLSAAADMIAEADVVETRLRGAQQWGLMPLHGVLSCVGPAFYARGRRNQMYRFPGWLGQNSKGMRMARQLREVQSHMRLRVAADKTEIRLSYLPAMVPELTRPLITQGANGIADVVSMMDHYYLTKDCWDAMLELHLEGDSILKEIPTAVKSSFTREYKKGSHPIAFQEHGKLAPAKATAAAAAAAMRPDIDEAIEEDFDEATETSDETGADDDDALVKPVKSAAKRAGSKAGKPKSDGATQRKRRKV
ncbi:DNA replication factor C complex subunit Rfc1 [Coemansia sp. RSA 2708]|nr:DNA replication factor C complex subunit Rfc1 [Coemansia sp. RSA 2708]